MIEVTSESGDAVYMQQKIAELLNEGWGILFSQTVASPKSGAYGYETIVYFKRSVSA